MKRLRFVLLLLLFALCVGSFAACGSIGVDLEKEGYTAKVIFDFQGGKLNIKNSAITGTFGLTFKPGSLVPNPLKMEGYTLSRTDFYYATDANGDAIWYKDKECTSAWDFKNDKAENGSITLYVKWIPTIKHTYTFCYKDEDGNIRNVYSYRISSEGEKLKKQSDLNLAREGWTPALDADRYWKDADCTQKWDMDFEHPGGENDCDVKVYVKYIEGEWNLVTDAATLKNALASNKNIYLMNDVDYGGAEWSVADYSSEFNGRGFKVYNTTQTLKKLTSRAAIIENLSGDAYIHDVTIEDVKYVVPDGRRFTSFKVSGFALTATENVKIKNVRVSGKIVLGKDVKLVEIGSDGNREYPLDTVKVAEDLKKAVTDKNEMKPENLDFTVNFVIESAENNR